MQDPTLVLRDIHQSPAPSWWPPAPGWWIVLAIALGSVMVWRHWRRRRQRRYEMFAALFDETVSRAETPPARIAAMSELLRRCARRRNASADRLQGEEWLAFLDGDATRPAFREGAGRLLLEGGFRRDADPTAVAALQELARARFIEWMTK